MGGILGGGGKGTWERLCSPVRDPHVVPPASTLSRDDFLAVTAKGMLSACMSAGSWWYADITDSG